MDNNQNGNNSAQNNQFQDVFMTELAGELQPEKPGKKRGTIIAVVVVLALLIAGAITFALWPKSCFRAADYEALVAVAQKFENGENSAVANVRQNENLFMQPIYFAENTVEVNTELSDDTELLYRSLGSYYEEYQKTAPIAVVLGSEYKSGASPELAKQRISKVKDELLKAGVAETSITANEPSAIVLNEGDELDEDVVDGMPVSVSIKPVSRCEE